MTQNTFPILDGYIVLTDGDGDTLSNGSINVYYTGTLNTAPVYQDQYGATALSNPVPLNALGQAQIFGLSNTVYDLYVYDSTQTLIGTMLGKSPGTGLLAGVVLIAGNQTVTGPLAFNGRTGIGASLTLAELGSGSFDAVIGSKNQTVGGVEIVGTQSANVSLTQAEGKVNGGFGYSTNSNTLSIFVGGNVVGTVTGNAVNFPDAATFSVNGQQLLTNTSVIPITAGGTGQNTAAAALIALLPTLVGNIGNVLTVASNTAVAWAANTTPSGSFGINGFFQVGSLVVQWGTSSYSGSGNPFTVNFPEAFPTACLVAVVSQGKGGFAPGVSSFTTTQILFDTSSLTGTAQDFYWIALGH